MKTIGRHRRTIIRDGRRYELCGLRVRPRPKAEPEVARVGWFSGVSLLLAGLAFVYALARPPAMPVDPEQTPQLATMQRFTIADFASVYR